MTAAVIQLPGVAPVRRDDLVLSPQEVQAATGGYKRAADQLRVLHERGFVRAYIPKNGAKRVVLERAHYDAVVRGQFGQVNEQPQRPAAVPNREALRQLFEKNRRK